MDELVGEHGTAGTLITAPTSLQFAVPDLHLLTPASAHPSHREPSVLPLYAAVYVRCGILADGLLLRNALSSSSWRLGVFCHHASLVRVDVVCSTLPKSAH